MVPTHIAVPLSPRPQSRPQSRTLGVTRSQAAASRAQSAKPRPPPPSSSPTRSRAIKSAGSVRKGTTQSLAKAWAPLTPATPLVINAKPMMSPTVSQGHQEGQQTTPQQTTPPAASGSDGKYSRAQSAPASKQRTPTPPQTPAPPPPPPTQREASDVIATPNKPDRVRSAHIPRSPEVRNIRPIKSAGTSRSSKVRYPRPFSPSPAPSEAGADSDTENDVTGVVDYNKQLKKHRWRMQVHGDPLKLK